MTVTVWMTGLSGAGKSTLAVAVAEALVGKGQPARVLDGDALREGINADLGFDAAGRSESARRVCAIAALFAEMGTAACVAMISPHVRDRVQARKYHTGLGLAFVEVHVATPLEVCLGRDEKRIYERGRRGEIRDVAGLDFKYEVSERPDLVVRPDVEPIEGMVQAVLDAVRVAGGVDLWKDRRNSGVKEAFR